MTEPADRGYREWAQVTLPAHLDAVPRAVEPLRRYLAARGAPGDAIDAVRLAVTEALTNAIKHGDTSPDAPEIRLDWSWHGEWLDAKISEPGHFDAPPDWADLPDDELDEGGRGGFLIATLMDAADHRNARGVHTLHLRKRLGNSPIAPGAAEELEQTLAAMTEDLSASYEVLSALFRLAEALATSDDLGTFARHVLEIRQPLAADVMEVRLRDAADQLVRAAATGASATPDAIPVDGPTIAAEAFRQGAEQTVEDRAKLPADDPLHGPAGGAFACPVVFQGRAWGVFAIARSRAGEFFTAGQLSLARTMAEFLGIACANAELQRQRRAQLQAQRELEIAAQIQRSLVPTHFPARRDWRMHGNCVNAQEVGGDFFDVIEVPGGVLVVIADVMGKGVPAALLALVLRTAVRAHAALAAHPGRLLTAVNIQLAADLERLAMFITVQALFLAAGAPRAVYASAGHCPMLRLRGGAHEPQQLPEGDTPLGVVGNETFQEYAVTLAPGERLVLLTDGITETIDATGQMLGLDGVSWLAARTAAQPVVEACRSLLAGVDGFGAGRAAGDDRTVVIIDCLADKA